MLQLLPAYATATLASSLCPQVGVHSLLANTFVHKLLLAGALPELGAFTQLRREVRMWGGQS